TGRQPGRGGGRTVIEKRPRGRCLFPGERVMMACRVQDGTRSEPPQAPGRHRTPRYAGVEGGGPWVWYRSTSVWHLGLFNLVKSLCGGFARRASRKAYSIAFNHLLLSPNPLCPGQNGASELRAWQPPFRRM